MINKIKEIYNKLDKKLDNVLNSIYANRKRNILILSLTIFIIVNILVGGFKVYLNFISDSEMCSSIVTDLIRDKKSNKDVEWVQSLYESKSVSPYIKDVVEAIDNEDTIAIDNIVMKLNNASRVIAVTLSLGIDIVIALSTLLIALFGKIIEEDLKSKLADKERVGLDNENARM